MGLYPVAGVSAGFPVSTDSFGARQDTSDLTQEILDQVDPGDFTLPWSSGGLTVTVSGVEVAEIGAPLYEGTNHSGITLRADDGSNVYFRTGGDKSFIIDHPLDADRWLVHVCLEGPEAAVFYRGEIRLDGVGSAHVELPDYFTALVDETTATVQVTPVLDGPEDPFGPVAATKVEDGRFVVRGWPMQNVAWRVEATRTDTPPVVVEPLKRDVKVNGVGPYRWIEGRK